MYIYMYSLLLGRVRASFIDGNFEQRKAQSRFGGLNLFFFKIKIVLTKTALGPSIMSERCGCGG